MAALVILKNFRLVDGSMDSPGSIIIEDGFIREVIPDGLPEPAIMKKARLVLDGEAFKGQAILMPSFVDLHAHFRDPGFPLKETLESASLAAAAGGFGTVICMANTNPVTDSLEKAKAIKQRADALGLIDLYPVMSLTKGMEGKELSDIAALAGPAVGESVSGANDVSDFYFPLMLSEDGKDIADDDLFLKAMAEARRLGVPVSCHCDFGGSEAEEAKRAGEPRKVWSRIEENNAVRRAIELGKKAGCHIHIAHVSTKEAAAYIRQAKKESFGSFTLTCEAAPHSICLGEETAQEMGDESFGRVNPPLRTQADREALKEAIRDGIIDAIATDHAPHTFEDKAKGAPGFTGLETAFAASFTELVPGFIDLKRLSALMSAIPSRLVGLKDRGQLKQGQRGDLVIVETDNPWQVEPDRFKSRGKNSPFTGKKLHGKILVTLRGGRIVFEAK